METTSKFFREDSDGNKRGLRFGYMNGFTQVDSENHIIDDPFVHLTKEVAEKECSLLAEKGIAIIDHVDHSLEWLLAQSWLDNLKAGDIIIVHTPTKKRERNQYASLDDPAIRKDYLDQQFTFDLSEKGIDDLIALCTDQKILFSGLTTEPQPVPELRKIDFYQPLYEYCLDYTEKPRTELDRIGVVTESMYRRGRLGRVLANQHATRPFEHKGRRRVLYGVERGDPGLLSHCQRRGGF